MLIFFYLVLVLCAHVCVCVHLCKWEPLFVISNTIRGIFNHDGALVQFCLSSSYKYAVLFDCLVILNCVALLFDDMEI